MSHSILGWLGFGDKQEQHHWFFGEWMKFDYAELFGGVDKQPDMDPKYVQALIWSLALIVFGLIVLRFDTREVRQRKTFNIRDRILGVEQRYFLAIFNGLVLCATLLYTM